MEPGFLHAFHAAIRAYRRGTIPIGCAILDRHGALVATGENSIHADDDKEVINRHMLAHAELNAILKVDARDNPELRHYTLYSTMEPCPLCFGAILMGRIRNVRYAAEDRFGGGAKLNDTIEYVRSAQIDMRGPDPALQPVQIALTVAHRLGIGMEWNVDLYRTYCPQGVEAGYALADDEGFLGLVRDGAEDGAVLDAVLAAVGRQTE